MLAVQYDKPGGIDVLELRDVPIPEPADDEVLIRVHAASLNPFDGNLRSGRLSDFFDVEFPITPGRDGCGEIVRVGAMLDQDPTAGLSPGVRVSFISSRLQHGAVAEFAAVRATDFVVATPSGLSDLDCASLPLVGLSAWNALVDTAKVERGMRVLIHGGSGGVGSVAIQIARHLGADVFATCSAARSGYVEDLGAKAIAYDRIDFTETVSDCDVVLDTVGGEIHEQSYKVLKPGGQLVYLIAKPFDDVSAHFEVQSQQVIVLNQTANLQHVMELAGEGIINSNISRSQPLAEFEDAFRFAESGASGGKVVLEINGSHA